MQTYIETSRLILRDWKEEDIPAFARMTPTLMLWEFFLHPLTPEESLAFITVSKMSFRPVALACML